MNIERLFEVGMKGLSLIHSLAQQGKDITPTVTALKNVFSKHPDQVTDKELDDVEEVLDRKLDEFEKPLTRKA